MRTSERLTGASITGPGASDEDNGTQLRAEYRGKEDRSEGMGRQDCVGVDDGAELLGERKQRASLTWLTSASIISDQECCAA